MTELVERALAWVADVHPHPRHLARTRDWLLVLHPTADEALQIAAVVHDIERAFPADDDPYDPGASPSADAYNEWHQQRSAQIARRWLHEQGASEELVEEVGALVAVHEDGGWPEADMLQAADSLSFLEVNAHRARAWVAEGRCTPAQARAKLDWMLERIRLPAARALAVPYHERSVAQLGLAA